MARKIKGGEVPAYQARNDGYNLTDIEIGWLAGIYEGEGTVYIGKGGRMELKIDMCDEDVVESIQGLFPCPQGIRTSLPKNPNWSTKYRWRLNRRHDIVSFLELILPLLHGRRSEKARLVISVISRA